MAITFTVARRELGRMIGPYGVFTATGGTTQSLVCAAAFQSSVLPTDGRAFSWVFVPGLTAPRQRRVTAIGLDGPTGTLPVDALYGAAVANGMVFEVSPRLPPVHESTANVGNAMTPSLQFCLNAAARHILIDQRDYSLTLVDGQNDYSLPSWLDRPERLLDVLVPSATGATRLPSWRTFEFRTDSGGGQLHFDDAFRFSGSYAAHLVVKRPADTYVNASETSGGFSAESDTLEVDLNQILPGALAFAYQALREQYGNPERARMDGLYRRAVNEFRRVKGYDKSNDMDPSVPTDAPAAVEAA